MIVDCILYLCIYFFSPLVINYLVTGNFQRDLARSGARFFLHSTSDHIILLSYVIPFEVGLDDLLATSWRRFLFENYQTEFNLLRLNAKKLIYGLYEYRFIINNNFSLSYEQPWGDGIWFDVFGNRAPRTLETCINLRFYMYLPRGFWASIAYQWCTDLSFKHFRHSVYLARSFNLVNCGHFY